LLAVALLEELLAVAVVLVDLYQDLELFLLIPITQLLLVAVRLHSLEVTHQKDLTDLHRLLLVGQL
jgi:hypothetical protein